MSLRKEIEELKKKKVQLEKSLERANSKIYSSIDAWKKKEEKFRTRIKRIVDRILSGKNTETQEMQKKAQLADEWLGLGDENREVRDQNFSQRDDIQKELDEVNKQLAIALAKEKAENDANDNIVNQVFVYREDVVNSLMRMNNFLTGNVYDRLIGQDGKLRSQITLDSVDGLRRVVAMVNSISKVDPALAADALLQINAFFDRVRPGNVKLDESTQVLYELTQKILIEKTSFSVGPDLYRFLSLDLDEEVFPELVSAQNLLKRSLRSEKTNSYIRLYRRSSRSDKWEPVPLTA